MAIQVEVTYDMSKLLGSPRFEVDASTVGEALEAARAEIAEG